MRRPRTIASTYLTSEAIQDGLKLGQIYWLNFRGPVGTARHEAHEAHDAEGRCRSVKVTFHAATEAMRRRWQYGSTDITRTSLTNLRLLPCSAR